MATSEILGGSFSALLKYWRQRRGLSQLDCSLTAEVSSRHISFLETGRSRPSEAMILRLGSALDVPLREQDVMLVAAGFEQRFESSGSQPLPSSIQDAIAHMLSHHDPYPLLVFDRSYALVTSNPSATRLLRLLISEPEALSSTINVLELLFDPRMLRPFVTNWQAAAKQLLTRVHRDVLGCPNDVVLTELRDRLLAYPGIPADWLVPDLSHASSPCFELHVRRDDLRLGFLTTLTQFNVPHTTRLQGLCIESYYPLDQETKDTCRRLAKEAT